MALAKRAGRGPELVKVGREKAEVESFTEPCLINTHGASGRMNEDVKDRVLHLPFGVKWKSTEA